MPNVVNVRIFSSGATYCFDPGAFDLLPGHCVIVETARGVELGEVTSTVYEVEAYRFNMPLKSIIQIADDNDIKHDAENKEKEKEAFMKCREKIIEHGLDMKLISAEYAFDNSKIQFYFTSGGRVDFRLLVKDLASIFKTRIDLRQIGVRDEAKMLGGLGPCGRTICCGSFLDDFQPVSIKMAKEQNLSLNPTKISGVCGRLMCCLKYEQDTYENTRKRMPKPGKEVEVPDGKGIVMEVNVVKETVRVRIPKGDSDETKEYALETVKFVSGHCSDSCAGCAPRPDDTSAKSAADDINALLTGKKNDNGNAQGDTADVNKHPEHPKSWKKAVEDAIGAAGKGK